MNLTLLLLFVLNTLIPSFSQTLDQQNAKCDASTDSDCSERPLDSLMTEDAKREKIKAVQKLKLALKSTEATVINDDPNLEIEFLKVNPNENYLMGNKFWRSLVLLDDQLEQQGEDIKLDFEGLHDFAFFPNDTVLLCDRDGQRLLVLEAESWTVKRTVALQGEPFGIDITKDGLLVAVTIRDSTEVLILNEELELVRTLQNVKTEDEEVRVCFTADNDLVLTEASTHIVKVLNNKNGFLPIAQFDSFKTPMGMCLSAETEQVLICDFNHGRIVSLEKDEQGEWVTDTLLKDPSGFHPVNVAIKQNKLIVTSYSVNLMYSLVLGPLPTATSSSLVQRQRLGFKSTEAMLKEPFQKRKHDQGKTVDFINVDPHENYLMINKNLKSLALLNDQFEQEGEDIEQDFEIPRDFAFFNNGTVVLCDSEGERLLVLETEGQGWAVKRSVAVQGKPWGIDISRDGLLVAVTLLKSTAVLLLDERLGLVQELRDAKRKVGPARVCFTADKDLVLSDFKSSTVKVFEQKSGFQLSAQFESFSSPAGMCLSAETNQVLICDHLNQRIVSLEKDEKGIWVTNTLLQISSESDFFPHNVAVKQNKLIISSNFGGDALHIYSLVSIPPSFNESGSTNFSPTSSAIND